MTRCCESSCNSHQTGHEDEEQVDPLRPRNAQLHHHGDGEREYEGIGDQIQTSDRKGQLAVGEAVHRHRDVPFAVPHVAESDDGGEGDPVVDGAVSDEEVDDVAELRLQLEDAQVE